jgi:hypothetical protein
MFPGTNERLKRLLKERSSDGKDDYPPLIGQPVKQYWFARALPRCAEWYYEDKVDAQQNAHPDG